VKGYNREADCEKKEQGPQGWQKLFQDGHLTLSGFHVNEVGVNVFVLKENSAAFSLKKKGSNIHELVKSHKPLVYIIPANAGIQGPAWRDWTPAFAGVTALKTLYETISIYARKTP